jgi:MSHA biogenesis protein MshK
MARRLIALFPAGLALLAMSVAVSTHAQLADPTKPPPSLSAPTGDTPNSPAASSGLQSVILRKSGKPAALINGEIVELGGRLGEARLIKVMEDAVVLRGPEGDETLRLTPAAEKKVGAGETAKKPPQKASKSKKPGTEP